VVISRRQTTLQRDWAYLSCHIVQRSSTCSYGTFPSCRHASMRPAGGGLRPSVVHDCRPRRARTLLNGGLDYHSPPPEIFFCTLKHWWVHFDAYKSRKISTMKTLTVAQNKSFMSGLQLTFWNLWGFWTSETPSLRACSVRVTLMMGGEQEPVIGS